VSGAAAVGRRRPRLQERRDRPALIDVQTIEVLFTSFALVALPIVTGALLGLGIRRVRGKRARGLTGMASCAALLLPVVAVYGRFPIVGLWDAGQEVLLLYAGVLLTGHGAFANRVNVLVVSCSTIAGLVLLEAACRLFLPAAPGFAGVGHPHLLLRAALQAADPATQPADTISKEIVCSVVYGDEYPGLFRSPANSSLTLPRTYTPRPGAARRVLHLGDSMVFGLGVARDETFTAALERLEPGVEHINGGIAGTAPDAYLAVLRQWLALQHVDEVVMYPFEGNDIRDVDGPYPCCEWQPLLAYGDDGASLRCKHATRPDLSYATWTWLRYNSPPPYLVRALIGRSVAAAYLGALMTEPGMRASLILNQSNETRSSHLAAILRSARDELSARHIPFVVVILPFVDVTADPNPSHTRPRELIDAARQAGARTLDPSDVILRAVADGQQLFLGSRDHPDIHFNARGHTFMAKWLHEHLDTESTAGAE
jgi:hypothetical protein